MRSGHSEGVCRAVQKPADACNYNSLMGGVDLFDQLSTTYHFRHKVQRWYHALWHFIKEAALVNSYILYTKENPNTTLTSAGFRRQVAKSLCRSLPGNSNAKKGRYSLDDLETTEPRLKERHFIYKFPEPSKRNCVVCSESKRSKFGCQQCMNSRGQHVALCVPDCWNRFHSLKHYTRNN